MWISGDAYFAAITARRSDRYTRIAFRRLALELSSANDVVFDFGAGPGIDAKFYAEHNRRVIAYDVDQVMCEAFERHCTEQIKSGSIRLLHASYPELLSSASATLQSASLVVANFAPFNLIEELSQLFRWLHAATAPEASIFASLLSPYFLGDARYPWWWRGQPHFWRDNRLVIQGAQARIVRRGFKQLAREGEPYFKLQKVFHGMSGLCLANLESATFGQLKHVFAKALLASSRYMFVLLKKQSLSLL
jgi:SAM-dependent methyltransferase